MKHLRMGLLPSVVVIPAFLLYLVGVNVIFDLKGISLIVWWILMLDFAFFALIHTLATLRTLIVFVGANSRQPRDVSAENTFPNPHVAPIIQELHGMGFTRLGETVTDVPLTKRSVVWHLANPAGTDVAGVIDLGTRLFALLEFSTTYMDEAALETLYPIGRRRDFPLLRVRFSTSNVAVAYEFHCQERLQMQKEHGLPRPFASMVEYLNWEMRYRELHSRTKLRGSLVSSMLTSLFLLTMIVFGVYAAITIDHPDLLSDKLDWALFCAMIGTALIVGLFGISATRHGHYMEALIKATKKRQDQTNKQAQKGRLK